MPPTSTRPNRRSATPFVAFALALAAAACSSSSGKTASTHATTATTPTTPTTAASTTTTTAGPSDVNLAQTKLGMVLVDKTGLTVYLYAKDTPTSSACTGVCAQAWPPVLVTGSPTAGTNVTAALTTLKRADGTTQLVVAGHPVYTFAGDSKPGDTSGNGVEKLWSAMTASGSPVPSAG
jgi:predicted lipoprotein with Yx(FWY)xxD motif